MATFKLNGTDVPFQEGDTIMRAAWREGIEIPHYCWHPGLSVAANCRMCLVEIRGGRTMNLPILAWDEATQSFQPATKPKLAPACQMQATEDMDVHSTSEEAEKAQASVQEFLLLNHPVDCPICDQAGECKLQDYWLDHQARLKRKTTEPVHKPKGVRFGPTIVYDAERCIMCTRCIRVCDELVGDHVLDMRERGNKNEIVLSPGRELNHDYTLMTEHVCPVGALTSRDFRFKARVWFLRAAPSVCPGCATGCASYIDYDPRYQRAERLRPRDNPEVNQFWMCDDGMMTYKRMHEGRLMAGLMRNDAGGLIATAPEEVLRSVAQDLISLAEASKAATAVVLSAQHSNEDNLALMDFAQKLGFTRHYMAAKPPWRGDEILRNTDQNPNRAGVTRVAGRRLPGTAELAQDVKAGHVKRVLVLGADCQEGEAVVSALASLPSVVVMTGHEGPLVEAASAVIPIAVHGEVDGSFVNAKGLYQTFRRAFRPPPGISSAWETLNYLAKLMELEQPFKSLSAIRAAARAKAGGSRSSVSAASASGRAAQGDATTDGGGASGSQPT